MPVNNCPKCNKPTAKKDGRKKGAAWVPQNRATIEEKPGFAPRVRCNGCGQLQILMTGRM
jgi:hypothetical protein